MAARSLSAVVALAVTVVIAACGTTTDAEHTTDVLIIQSSGVPGAKVTELSTDDVDAVTLPTPGNDNVLAVAERTAALLETRGLTVRIADAGTVRAMEELMSPRMLVIGSPSYFNTVSWQVKKFIDEVFVQVYNLSPDKFAGKPVAIFSMAAGRESAVRTREYLELAVSQCYGVPGPCMDLVTGDGTARMDAAVRAFADSIAAVLDSPPR